MAANVSGEADGLCDTSACSEDSFSAETTENNGTRINSKKKKNSIMGSLRKSLRRVGEISPSPLRNKEPNSKIERTNTGNDLDNSFDYTVQSPASPRKYDISIIFVKNLFLDFVFSQEKKNCSPCHI